MIKVIDSHTEGEPTRVILEGAPDLGDGTLQERLTRLQEQHDDFRRAVILEPRGYEAMVGALLCKPDDPSCETAVMFFNNHNYLPMCGHGTIGVAATLAHLKPELIGTKFRIQSPAGMIEVDLQTANRASLDNVSSYRYKTGVEFTVGKHGTLTGDIAWGGNWFYILPAPLPIVKENMKELIEVAGQIRQQILASGTTGADGAEIDHVEFFEKLDANRGRNFVICPGGEFDRSPCGTGTSALLACFSADGKIGPGEQWVQESMTGGVFKSSYRTNEKDQITPNITGSAYICGEATLYQHPDDPYRCGNDFGCTR